MRTIWAPDGHEMGTATFDALFSSCDMPPIQRQGDPGRAAECAPYSAFAYAIRDIELPHIELAVDAPPAFG